MLSPVHHIKRYMMLISLLSLMILILMSCRGGVSVRFLRCKVASFPLVIKILWRDTLRWCKYPVSHHTLCLLILASIHDSWLQQLLHRVCVPTILSTSVNWNSALRKRSQGGFIFNNNHKTTIMQILLILGIPSTAIVTCYVSGTVLSFVPVTCPSAIILPALW